MFVYLSPSNQIGNTYYGNNLNECYWCERIAKATYNALIRSHVKAVLPTSDSMYARIGEANAMVRDLGEDMLYVPIHTNATGLKNSTRRGTNIYNYGTENGKLLATAIYNAVMDIDGAAVGKGGIPTNKTWYEMKNSRGICAYCEVEYHDCKAGAEWIVKHIVEIGEAIARGICTFMGREFVELVENEDDSGDKETLYYVQIGAFKVKANAEAYMRRAIADGYDAFIKTTEDFVK